jgi:hypothetical protein
LYANEDVMLGAWMLGLDVQYSHDATFCCGDIADCGAASKRAASVLKTGHGLNDDAGGEGSQKEDSGVQWRLAQLQESLKRARICVLYSGGCNGVCGADSVEKFAPYRKCVAVL